MLISIYSMQISKNGGTICCGRKTHRKMVATLGLFGSSWGLGTTHQKCSVVFWAWRTGLFTRYHVVIFSEYVCVILRPTGMAGHFS